MLGYYTNAHNQNCKDDLGTYNHMFFNNCFYVLRKKQIMKHRSIKKNLKIGIEKLNCSFTNMYILKTSISKVTKIEMKTYLFKYIKPRNHKILSDLLPTIFNPPRKPPHPQLCYDTIETKQENILLNLDQLGQNQEFFTTIFEEIKTLRYPHYPSHTT